MDRVLLFSRRDLRSLKVASLRFEHDFARGNMSVVETLNALDKLSFYESHVA